MPRSPRFVAACVAALAVSLAFCFLGLRGVWDPDEGRYTNVALVMLDTGDWLTPMRNGETGHWTKPPMTYWLVAASVAVFGQHAWAARLPIALAYLLCAWFAGRTARVLAPGSGTKASLVFATMLAPFGAAHLVTTDFLLAAACAAAMHAYVRSRFGAHPDPRWLAAMGAAFGVAFLIKGPPGLLPALAIAVFAAIVRVPGAGRWRWHGVGLACFAAVALPWYMVVVARHEGLLAYFLGAELVDRVATNRFDRNGEWYGWLKVYGPMLLLGSLPWTGALWRWLRTWPTTLRGGRDATLREARADQWLLLAWIGLPLLVFCFAQSRLPLYVLPLFVPIALAVACALPERLPRWPWFAAWVAVLLGVRIVAAHWPTQIDAAAWAEAITARVDAPVRRVVFVEDKARWGLHLHLDAQVERHSREARDEPAFGRGFDAHFATALATGAVAGTVYVVPVALWEELQAVVEAEGFIAHAHGEPHLGRQVFGLRPSR